MIRKAVEGVELLKKPYRGSSQKPLQGSKSRGGEGLTFGQA